MVYLLSNDIYTLEKNVSDSNVIGIAIQIATIVLNIL